MARLQAGLGESTEGIVPSDVGVQAASNPILQSDEHTHRVQEWYESVYGSDANYREQVLGNYIEDEVQGISMPMDRHAEYCQLPEERDAWNRGLEVTQRYRQLEGLPNPPLASDSAICSPDAEDAVSR